MSHRFGHMLGIEPLTAEEIVFLLDQSKPFQEIQRHPLKKLATLRGKTVALAFFEPSTYLDENMVGGRPSKGRHIAVPEFRD